MNTSLDKKTTVIGYMAYGFRSLLIILLLVVTQYSQQQAWGAFDKFENWGFEQGGGLRSGDFIGQDAELVGVCMSINSDATRLAIGGAMHETWAVRVYELQDTGPVLMADWNGSQKDGLVFATITSMDWAGNQLACGFQSLNGKTMQAGVLLLDPNNQNQTEVKFFHGWETVAAISVDPASNNLLKAFGTKANELEDSFCLTLNISRKTTTEFKVKGLAIPRSMIMHDGRILFCGEREKGRTAIRVFQRSRFDNTELDLERGIFVSSMKASGKNIFLTGRKIVPDAENEMEDFVLSCLSWDKEQKTIEEKWSIESESFQGQRDREIGIGLLPLSNGSVLVAGNFRQHWKLGPSNEGRLALLPPDSAQGLNFEAFLALYDQEGDLQWAQTSELPGDDFSVEIIGDGEGNALLLGNRIVGSGFGPYLNKVRLAGHTEQNAALVARDVTSSIVISWRPPKTLRFGEPIDSRYLSARAVARGTFEYKLDGEILKLGDLPLFEPGEMELSVRMISGGGVNGAVRTIKGLKGRPYLKVHHQQVGSEVRFSGELSGLHPDHFTDLQKNETLHNSIEFELVKDEGNQIIEGGRLAVENDFTGRFEVVAFFPGDSQYESASRRIFLQARNGDVFKPGEESSSTVTIQVKDLDGWQTERIVPIGEQTFISATQGFGRKRKFKKWMEFSEEDKTLTTARVQSPFKLRTALLAEEDMTLFAKYNFTFAGAAVNGYLSGSSVFLDYNLNGELDDDEPIGFTTNNGGFEIEVTEEDILANDTNGNGFIDIEEGVIVVLGGTDRSSGLPLEISYKAPPSYSVITAVSTVVAEIALTGKSLEESENILSDYLDLPKGIDLATFEPLEAVFSNEEAAQEFLLRATQLSNLLNEGSRYLQMTTGNQVSRTQGASLIVSVISEEILERSDSSAPVENKKLSLGDPVLLEEVLADADQQARAIAEQNSDTEEDFYQTSSARAQLTKVNPEITENGNLEMLERLINQVTSANVALEELANEPSVSAQNFKAFASASQNVLNDLGDFAVNTLSPQEVESLQQNTSTEPILIHDIISSATSVEEILGNEEERELERKQKFSLQELEEQTIKSNTNVYAPRLINTKIYAEDLFTDNLIIGNFEANDPEGGDVIYSFVGENPDLNGDGLSLLHIDERTGLVRIQDYDELKLMITDSVRPILRVMDTGGMFADQLVEVNIAEWTYLAGRKRLADFNSGEGLTVREKMPAGTLVGQLVTNDPDDGELLFSMVAGDGDSGNSNFSIKENGDLVSNKRFDYATNPFLSIRVRATNQDGKSHEKKIQVKITEGFSPILDTSIPYYYGSGSYWVGGQLLDVGIRRESVEVGILVSGNPIIVGLGEGLKKYVLQLDSADSFGMEFIPDSSVSTLYTLAYAKNEKGTSYGLVEKLTIKDRDTITPDYLTVSSPIKDSPGWWLSSWFGTYYFSESNGWIFHLDLGWLYPSKSDNDGLWLWKNSLGWLWTKQNIYPFLFSNESGSWLYFYGDYNETRLLYDYARSKWIAVSDVR